MNSIQKAFFLSLPFFISVLALIIGILPFNSLPTTTFHIPVVFGIIYYFTIFRPGVLNVFWVFVLGVLADLLMHVPLGVHPLLFITLLFTTALNRRFLASQEFDGQWLGFMLIFFLIIFIRYLSVGVLLGQIPDVSFFFWEYVFVSLCYPLTALLCGYLNRKIGEVG